MSLRFETIALVGRPQTLGLENTLAAMAAAAKSRAMPGAAGRAADLLEQYAATKK